MFENPTRGRQAINFTINAPKILVLKSSSEQIFPPKIDVGCPCYLTNAQSKGSFKSDRSVQAKAEKVKSVDRKGISEDQVTKTTKIVKPEKTNNIRK